jgi:uncharacterized protein (TIGR03435 family)
MRRVVLAALVLITSSALIDAQAPVRFDVASIRPDPKQDRGGPQKLGEFSMPMVRVLPGGRVESYGHTLRNLIAFAYDINTIQQRIEGKQEVLELEFNISARAAADSLTPAEARAMMRTLLEERFQLRLRPQARDVDSYRMEPSRDDGRPGPALRAFTGDCETRANNKGIPFESPDYEERRPCGWSAINHRQRGVGLSMAAIAERLTMFMATPVTDRTGWPGLFTFDVIADTRNTPYQAVLSQQAPGFLSAPQASDLPQLLDVFRSELGLKLVKERATLNDFIVERIEPLIEN